MKLLDQIIQNRDHILNLTKKHGVIQLRLYGSVLARRETEQSDIDFLAIFEPSLPYDWEDSFNLQEELELYFSRRVSITDSRRIPDVFRLSIDTDPVDIMELSNEIYTITPKSSKLYYTMLDRMFEDYIEKGSKVGNLGYPRILCCELARKTSWWFSRLLRLDDNDLKEYSGFEFVEVLYSCEELSDISLLDYMDEKDEEDEVFVRFKQLMDAVRSYVRLRIKL